MLYSNKMRRHFFNQAMPKARLKRTCISKTAIQKAKSLALGLLLSLAGSFANAAEQQATQLNNSTKKTNELNSVETRKVIQKALSAFYTPGMSVGVVHKGEVVFIEGLG